MTKYNSLNKKLSNLQLFKFKSGTKNHTGVNFSSKVIGDSNYLTNFPLTDT